MNHGNVHRNRARAGRIFRRPPERLVFVATSILAVCVLVYRARRRMPRIMTAAGALWLLFAVWEQYAQDSEIRVDLIWIWPVIIAATFYGIVEVVFPSTFRILASAMKRANRM